MSLRELKSEIPEPINHETIRTILNSSSIKCKHMCKVPKLTEEHKFKRIEFSKNMLLEVGSYHQKILFSDEKRF